MARKSYLNGGMFVSGSEFGAEAPEASDGAD